MKNFSVSPQGVCASEIQFELEDGKIYNVKLTGGCPGNSVALSKAIDGMDAKKVQVLFEGITCGFKPTSCSDQLAKAIADALDVM